MVREFRRKIEMSKHINRLIVNNLNTNVYIGSDTFEIYFSSKKYSNAIFDFRTTQFDV